MPKLISSRAQAAKILIEVLQKRRSLSQVLNEQLKNYPTIKDRGFIQELCYGVMRWYEQLIFITRILITKPLKSADQDILNLILIGIYQLKFLQTKPHAAIYETAQAARELKKPWAVGLINGVLREWQRQHAIIENKIQQEPKAKYALPQWLLKQMQQAYPEYWENIATANNTHPPLILRINPLKISRQDYLTKLAANNILAVPTKYSPTGIQLITPQDITQLPGYADGEFSVQDEAAQLAATLLDLSVGQNILDACAAPGGKTAHILEAEPNLNYLIAIDSEALRLTRITENLTRLQLLNNQKVKLICEDASQPEKWWDGKLFDRILVDAPCSALGVIRRHPDIKYLRRKEDIEQLTLIQKQILTALWPLLKPNGILVYATCSILPQENYLPIKEFIQQHADSEEIKVSADWGIATDIGRQIFPAENGMDGFYYAVLRKR